MRSPPFDALVFDLGGVIVAHDNALRDARLAARCRAPCPPSAVRVIVDEPRWMTGEGTAEMLHEELDRRLGYDGDWPDFRSDWCCHFSIDGSMLRLVDRLRRRHRVLIFSNTEKVHLDFLLDRSGGALARFEPYLSFEIGVAKPSVRSFEVVAEMASIRPSRSLFVDDMAANVEGARRAGFVAEIFEGEAKLARSLAAMGIALE